MNRAAIRDRRSTGQPDHCAAGAESPWRSAQSGNDAETTGGGHGFVPRMGVEFAHRAAQITLDRFRAQRKPLSDSLVGATQRDLREYIDFAAREPRRIG